MKIIACVGRNANLLFLHGRCIVWRRTVDKAMNKLQQAAKALNTKAVNLPTLGRSVELPNMKICHWENGFCRVFNITKLGRIGSHIGWLKLDVNGVWHSAGVYGSAKAA